MSQTVTDQRQPGALAAALGNVPRCLRERRQWVAWKYIERDGKQTKCPVDPSTGVLADSTDASTWGTFEEAVAACEQRPDLAGVGFVFTRGDPFCGVDLDDSIDQAAGQVKPWAQQIIQQLDSYTEISPSGRGVKIFLRARKPGPRCRKACGDGEVEMYDDARFFTVTGRHLPQSPADVEDRHEQLSALYSRVFGGSGDDPASAASSEPSNGSVTNLRDDTYVHLDDSHILQLASSQRRTGAKFAALWAGHWNDYFNSSSEADSSVVFTLAFYTKDAAQIDRLFRQSALMRAKWDEMHGQQTYGQMTIAKALQKVTKQYEPKRRRNRPVRKLRLTGADERISGEPAPGTVDPSTGRLILSTDRTLPTAEAFVEEFCRHPEGRTLQHYAGMLMAWRDNRYVEVEDGAMRNQLLPWLHAAVRMDYSPAAERWVPEDFPANPRTVTSALESIKAYTHLNADVVSPSWLGPCLERPDPHEILPCRTSLLHLPTLRHLPPTPAFFAINALDYDPDPHAGPPEAWLSFLHQLFDDDMKAWDLLQEWFGYCLTGDTSQHKMLLIIGPRRSGKGTIARVLAKVIGAGNVCGPTSSSLAGPFGLQPLIGKSLAVVSDARFSGENVHTVVERLLCISGEDTLTIDRKHQSSVTMRLPTRFVFLTNELPRLCDASGALSGRFMMLRLTESFYGREDKELTEKLLAELPGILNWAIEGWHRLRQRGHFIQPASVKEALRGMEDLSSPVGAFVRECCDVGSGHRVWVDELYCAWKAWCEQEGRSLVTTRQTFGRDLMAVIPGLASRVGTGNFRFYQGIKLKGKASC